MDTASPAIGHNLPPADDVRAELALKYDGDELLISNLERQAKALPDTIDDDAGAGAFSNLIQRINKEAKGVEAYRVREKEPYLQGGRAVDGWFATLQVRLSAHKNRLERILTDYLRRKEAAARAEREAQAKREREAALEAARAQAAAVEAARPIEAAVHGSTLEANHAASKATAHSAATAKPADFARTRSDEGNLATLVQTWTFEVVDADAVREQLGELGPYFSDSSIETAIRAFVKNGRRELKGVRIFSTSNAAVR